MVDFLSF
jgi:hypothetical protein